MQHGLKTRREAALRPAITRVVDRRTTFTGTIEFPCLPALTDHILQRIADCLSGFGHVFSRDETNSMKAVVGRALDAGYEASSEARLTFKFSTPPGKGVEYEVGVRHLGMEERYETWASLRKPPLFGKLPDAMVMNTAASLGAPEAVRVLDVGAGTGRNAIALARLGHPVTAVEPVANFAEQLRAATAEERLPITVAEDDVLSADVPIERGSFGLVVIAEVLTHFRDAGEVREAFAKFADALSPGGIVVANTFIATHSYRPDPLAKQVGEMSWSSFFTEGELAFITRELPFEKIEDEPVWDYEKAHLPDGGEWPPTGWFENWSNGRNVFETSPGIPAPIDLRWLVFRRRT
jgi:SAM-dependent methyltransferase